MDATEFLQWIAKNAARVREYANGGDGSGGRCDCIGLIIGAWRMAGNAWPWIHGSNYTARYLTEGLAADRPLRLGDLVYKARPPGAKGYDLPDRYSDHPDMLDYYHVGVVTRLDPLQITHCTSVPGGIKRDDSRGAWKYSGRFSKLTEDPEPVMSKYRATVTSPNGGPVNLRTGPGLSYDLVAKIKAGTVVDVVSDKDGWAFVRTPSRQGYMSTDYLRDLTQQAPDNPSHDAAAGAGAQLRDTIRRAIAQLDTAVTAIDTVRALLQDALNGEE